jgi:hypothetical protein
MNIVCMKWEHSNYTVHVAYHKDLDLEELLGYFLYHVVFLAHLYPFFCMSLKIRLIRRAENRLKVSDNKELRRI